MVFLSFQANRQLDFACLMEISALKLKQSALWSYNIALAGTACGKLLHSLEELFGVPESEASKREGARIASTEYRAPEVETPEEAAATVIEKPTISTPPTDSSTPSASAVRPPPSQKEKGVGINNPLIQNFYRQVDPHSSSLWILSYIQHNNECYWCR